tara:strand:- start:62 stop:1150 length:1089 start_codon:yes stop_codon:yes gene_type:complete
MKNKLKKFFRNKKVIVTGHTGFKGSWLALWLKMLGAKVLGVSNSIPSSPSHFNSIKLSKKINHKKMDIRDIRKLKALFRSYKPDYVFHLAAQSLVKRSYDDTLYTWQTNTIGTINVLESLRVVKKNCVAVIITSDKSYKNLELKRGYHENDLLGGKDPYSASKASAELAISSYISSFMSSKKNKLRIGIARAGNVIGGGDWSEDRLVPDCVKAWSKSKKVMLRNPYSTRPWQHVLEALRGYLILATKLKNNKNLHGEAFNFGPRHNFEKNVVSLVKEMKKHWVSVNWSISKNKKYYESKLLKLNSNKAKKILKWSCTLNFKETIELVTLWYKNFYRKKENSFYYSKKQIIDYEKKIKNAKKS